MPFAGEPLQDILFRHMERMPEKRQLVLELCVIESKSYREIAVQTNSSINTIKGHLKKAYSFPRGEVKREIDMEDAFRLNK